MYGTPLNLTNPEWHALIADGSRQQQHVRDAIAGEPVQVDGTAMSQVQGDGRAPGEVEGLARHERSEKAERSLLPGCQDIVMKGHLAALLGQPSPAEA